MPIDYSTMKEYTINYSDLFEMKNAMHDLEGIQLQSLLDRK